MIVYQDRLKRTTIDIRNAALDVKRMVGMIFSHGKMDKPAWLYMSGRNIDIVCDKVVIIKMVGNVKLISISGLPDVFFISQGRKTTRSIRPAGRLVNSSAAMAAAVRYINGFSIVWASNIGRSRIQGMGQATALTAKHPALNSITYDISLIGVFIWLLIR